MHIGVYGCGCGYELCVIFVVVWFQPWLLECPVILLFIFLCLACPPLISKFYSIILWWCARCC